ncbi:MAG: hypothetical protein II128_02190, partial [Atopobiaceae bacterium]|nr:hypothetical protein [Atopobiaceae bacterium]
VKVEFAGIVGEDKFDRAMGSVRHLLGIKADGNNAAHTPAPKRVIINDPATVVFFKDGSKAVTKAKDGDEYDPLFGIMACALRKVGKNRVRIDAWEPVIDFLSSYIADAKECRVIADMLNMTADALELDGVMKAMEEYDEREDTPDCQVFDTTVKDGTTSAVGELETRVADIEKGRERTRQAIRDLIDRGEL